MNKSYLGYLPFIGFRVSVVAIVVGIFLPPDSQNPHVLADLFLCASGGILWAMSDLFLKEIK
jgi:zinc transporter ZupT